MAREKRQLSDTNTYHVVIRGTNRQLMFENSKDYYKYLDLLEYYSDECGFDIYAYALMGNHIHILLYTPTTSLETVFRKLNTNYAVWFNSKYDRVGYLQQGRYYSEPIESDAYLMNCIRYIHFNPMRAGLEEKCDGTYAWSSWNEYIDPFKTRIVNTDKVVKMFGGMENFMYFHAINSDDECLDVHNIVRRLPDDVAKDIMLDKCHCATATDFQKLSDLEIKRNIQLLYKSGLSIRQINRLTGLSKGKVEREIRTEGHSLRHFPHPQDKRSVPKTSVV